MWLLRLVGVARAFAPCTALAYRHRDAQLPLRHHVVGMFSACAALPPGGSSVIAITGMGGRSFT